MKKIDLDFINTIPIFHYRNLEKNKTNILSQNKNKSGIYCWINIITNEIYIGRSINLSKRLGDYYNLNLLNRSLKNYNSKIYRAILKHGISNFNLQILEYCDKDVLVEREQYYITLLNPEYNIIKINKSKV